MKKGFMLLSALCVLVSAPAVWAGTGRDSKYDQSRAERAYKFLAKANKKDIQNRDVKVWYLATSGSDDFATSMKKFNFSRSNKGYIHSQNKEAVSKLISDACAKAKKDAISHQASSKMSKSVVYGAAAGLGIGATDFLVSRALADRDAFAFLNWKKTKELSPDARRALRNRFLKQLAYSLGALVTAGGSAYAAKQSQGTWGRTAFLLAGLTALEQGAKFGGRKALEAHARRKAARAEEQKLVPAMVGA